MDLTNIINGIEARAAAAIKPENGDYEHEGLLYCGKCKTPKQCRVVFLGEERTVHCLCKCGKEQRDAEQRELEQQQRMQHIQRLRVMGFPDDEMRRWTFANDDGTNEQISAVAHNYVKNFDEMKRRNKGLLLFGDVGTGKSFMAACIANALISKNRPCMMTSFSRLVKTIEGMREGKQNYLDGLNRFELLIIDDLASERDTEYMGELVQDIIDSRYRSGLPLIVTTNLTSAELKHPAEMRKQRIYSRLFEMCMPIEVKGKDRRKQKLKADYNELGAMLGIQTEGE